MGLTWIIGEHKNHALRYLLTINTGVLVFEVPELLPLAYIFTVFVAFQGLAIFIFFVPLSKQVREAYSKWWKVKVAESDILSKHFGEFSSIKRTSLVRHQIISYQRRYDRRGAAKQLASTITLGVG